MANRTYSHAAHSHVQHTHMWRSLKAGNKGQQCR